MSSDADAVDQRQDRVAAGAESVSDRKRRKDGPTLVYTDKTARDRAVELLSAYRWPVVLLVIAVIAYTAYVGGVGAAVAWVPGSVWSGLAYLGLGCLLTLIPAHWVYTRYFKRVEGVEISDVDPVTGRDRHLRVGWDLWDRVDIRSPWGGTLPVNDLESASINGRQGYKVMDFRVRQDGTPTCTAVWTGEASGTEIRTYRLAFIYARKRLARKADKYEAMRASQSEIAREIAERVVLEMVRTSEQSGMPGGEHIQGAIDDVMDTMDTTDPVRDSVAEDLGDDLADDVLDDDRGDDQADAPDRRQRLRNDGGMPR